MTEPNDPTDHLEWMDCQTRMALEEAQAGDFASADEVAALALKWSGTRGRPPQGAAWNNPDHDGSTHSTP